MRVSVDKALLEKALNYMAGRPYAEVADLISALMRDAQPVDEGQKAAERTVTEGAGSRD